MIVTDFHLDDGTGPDLLRKYKDLRLPFKEPLFILLTGEDPNGREVKSVRQLFFEVLIKPLKLSVWNAVFQRCLNHYEIKSGQLEP